MAVVFKRNDGILIGDAFNDPAGNIFLCQNGDVFIFVSNVTQTAFSKFKEGLLHIAKYDAKEAIEKMARYSVDMRWGELSEIIGEKFSAIAEEDKKRKEQQIGRDRQARRQEILGSLSDSDLIRTINKRRLERKQIEVVFVEDDLYQRSLIHMAISSDCQVTPSSDGLSCIANYISTAPDILFLDIGLPDVNGHDILKRILAIDPEAYIVMLSANGHKDNVIQALEAGAKGFIAKPFTKEKLLQYIGKSTNKAFTKKADART